MELITVSHRSELYFPYASIRHDWSSCGGTTINKQKIIDPFYRHIIHVVYNKQICL